MPTLEYARAKKISKSFEDSQAAENLKSVPLSHQTVQRKIVDIGEQVEKSLLRQADKSAYFSLYLDESTDPTDIIQIFVFVRFTSADFPSKDELLDLCSLYGTIKGKDALLNAQPLQKMGHQR